jgi:hypothetical protein
MQIYPRRTTDEEYVEATRKLIRRSKWFGLFFAAGGVFFLVMFEALWHVIHSDEGLMADISPGVHIGIMLGAMGGIFLLLAIQSLMCAAQYFKGQRTERLMPKFHDELKKTKESSNPPPLAGPPTGNG